MRAKTTAAIVTLLLAVLAWSPPAAAAEDGLAAFFGTFGGDALAKNRESRYFGVGLRASEITIAKDGDGFTITWSTTKKGDGDAKTKSTSLTFEPAARAGVYKATESGEPADGKPYIWASVRDRTMTMYILAVNEKGGYDLSVYERTVTDDGMDIRFRRIRDGEPMRIVAGELKRLK